MGGDITNKTLSILAIPQSPRPMRNMCLQDVEVQCTPNGCLHRDSNSWKQEVCCQGAMRDMQNVSQIWLSQPHTSPCRSTPLKPLAITFGEFSSAAPPKTARRNRVLPDLTCKHTLYSCSKGQNVGKR